MRLVVTTMAAVLCSGCHNKLEAPLPASAPRACALIRGSYCIEQVGLTIEESGLRIGGARLIIYDRSWQSTPLVVWEPVGCRRRLSNMTELIRVHRSDGQLILDVRLRRDGTCDLRISTGDKETDPAGNGFFTAMTQIRACIVQPCAGTVIGARVRSQVDWDPLTR